MKIAIFLFCATVLHFSTCYVHNRGVVQEEAQPDQVELVEGDSLVAPIAHKRLVRAAPKKANSTKPAAKTVKSILPVQKAKAKEPIKAKSAQVNKAPKVGKSALKVAVTTTTKPTTTTTKPTTTAAKAGHLKISAKSVKIGAKKSAPVIHSAPSETTQLKTPLTASAPATLIKVASSSSEIVKEQPAPKLAANDQLRPVANAPSKVGNQDEEVKIQDSHIPAPVPSLGSSLDVMPSGSSLIPAPGSILRKVDKLLDSVDSDDKKKIKDEIKGEKIEKLLESADVKKVKELIKGEPIIEKLLDIDELKSIKSHVKTQENLNGLILSRYGKFLDPKLQEKLNLEKASSLNDVLKALPSAAKAEHSDTINKDELQKAVDIVQKRNFGIQDLGSLLQAYQKSGLGKTIDEEKVIAETLKKGPVVDILKSIAA